jgi:hypothetical protein
MIILKSRLFHSESNNIKRVIIIESYNLKRVIIIGSLIKDSRIKKRNIEEIIKNMSNEIIYIDENIDHKETLDIRIDEMILDMVLTIKKGINNYNF